MFEPNLNPWIDITYNKLCIRSVCEKKYLLSIDHVYSSFLTEVLTVALFKNYLKIVFFIFYFL